MKLKFDLKKKIEFLYLNEIENLFFLLCVVIILINDKAL